MNRKALLGLLLLLGALVPVMAAVADCSSSTFCVQISNTSFNNDAITFSSSAKVVSHNVPVTDAATITDSVLVTSGLRALRDAVTIAESLTFTLSNAVSTVTQTITAWVTQTIGGCGSSHTNCTPVGYGDTAFDSFLSYILIPAITLILYVGIALAAKVRSFTVLALFGMVGILMMASASVVPGWIPLLLVMVLAATTTRVLGSFLGSSSMYSTMVFLLLMGAFVGIYTSNAGTPAAVACSASITAPVKGTGYGGTVVVTTSTSSIYGGAIQTFTITTTIQSMTTINANASLTQTLCQQTTPTLPCLGNIFGYCVVSDILNGLTALFNVFGSLTSSPVSTALTLGILFLVLGVIAGIAGFGQLMNVVFAVGLGVSLFYFANTEIALYNGVPAIVYGIFNTVIGAAELYIFWEAFRGSGGGGASTAKGGGSGTSGGSGKAGAGGGGAGAGIT